MDPSLITGAIGGAAAVAGKEFISSAVKKLFQRADNIDTKVNEEFKIDGRELTVLCPENRSKYSMAIIPKKSHFFPKSIEFATGRPISVELRNLVGLQQIPEALELTPDGFKISFKDLSIGEIYLLDIEYLLENPRWLDALVERSKPRDVPHDGEGSVRKYEISAQLKYLNVLKENYRVVNLKDLEMSVDVAVHQDINTSIPGIFRQQLETLVEISKPQSRSKYHQLMMRHQHLQRAKYGGKSIDILKDLQDLFMPTHFKQFIDVEGRDFRYQECSRGTSYFDSLPFETWPKFMKVISRTNLNLENPGADGLIIYKHANFIAEIRKLFESHK